jgi:hypothetical protein
VSPDWHPPLSHPCRCHWTPLSASSTWRTPSWAPAPFPFSLLCLSARKWSVPRRPPPLSLALSRSRKNRQAKHPDASLTRACYFLSAPVAGQRSASLELARALPPISPSVVSSHSRSSLSSSVGSVSSPVTPRVVGAPQGRCRPPEHIATKETPPRRTASLPHRRRAPTVSHADHHLVRRHPEAPLVLASHTLSSARRHSVTGERATAPRHASMRAVFPAGLGRALLATVRPSTVRLGFDFLFLL